MSQGSEGQETPAAFPERLGRYEILLPIARGGMGVVYLAQARGPGGFEREVALKLLHRHFSDGERYALELVEEAKLAVLIRHPNVVQILDVDEGPLGVFMTMEYVEGTSLDGLLRAAKDRGDRLPPEIGLRILLDALSGLHAAHELEGRDGRPLGLVHRDFSPQNILVGADGISKLADFGIAKASSRSGHTITGTIKGKVAYMAPEQLTGAPLDRRCDVWAAGVVAWELMAGRYMVEASDDIVLMYRIAHEPAPRLRAAGIDVSIELDDAIARALASAPAARCPTAAAFARTLEATGVEVAPPDEVAAYVRRLIGPELAERRARIAEILERRRDAAGGVAPVMPAGEEPTSSGAPGGLRVLRIGAAIAVSFLLAFGAWRALRPTSAAPPAEPSSAPAPPAIQEPQAAQNPASLDAPAGSRRIEGPPSSIAPPSPKPTTAAPSVVSSAKASPKRGTRTRPLAASPYERAP